MYSWQLQGENTVTHYTSIPTNKNSIYLQTSEAKDHHHCHSQPSFNILIIVSMQVNFIWSQILATSSLVFPYASPPIFVPSPLPTLWTDLVMAHTSYTAPHPTFWNFLSLFIQNCTPSPYIHSGHYLTLPIHYCTSLLILDISRPQPPWRHYCACPPWSLTPLCSVCLLGDGAVDAVMVNVCVNSLRVLSSILNVLGNPITLDGVLDGAWLKKEAGTWW